MRDQVDQSQPVIVRVVEPLRLACQTGGAWRVLTALWEEAQMAGLQGDLKLRPTFACHPVISTWGLVFAEDPIIPPELALTLHTILDN
jgi:hypothetical protein